MLYQLFDWADVGYITFLLFFLVVFSVYLAMESQQRVWEIVGVALYFLGLMVVLNFALYCDERMEWDM